MLAALQNLESETQAHAVSVHAGLRGQATAPSVCVGGRQRKALGPGCRSAANAGREAHSVGVAAAFLSGDSRASGLLPQRPRPHLALGGSSPPAWGPALVLCCGR